MFLNQKGDFIYLKPRYILKGKKVYLIKSPENNYKNYFKYLNQKKIKKHLRKYDFFCPSKFKNILRFIYNKMKINNPCTKYLLFENKRALKLTNGIFQLFYFFCLKKKITPIILFLPKLKGEFSNESNLFYLKNKITKCNIPNLYPRNKFFDRKENLIEKYYCKKNHYSFLGGKVIANSILEFLKERNLF